VKDVLHATTEVVHAAHDKADAIVTCAEHRLELAQYGLNVAKTVVTIGTRISSGFRGGTVICQAQQPLQKLQRDGAHDLRPDRVAHAGDDVRRARPRRVATRRVVLGKDPTDLLVRRAVVRVADDGADVGVIVLGQQLRPWRAWPTDWHDAQALPPQSGVGADGCALREARQYELLVSQAHLGQVRVQFGAHMVTAFGDAPRHHGRIRLVVTKR